MTAQSSIQKIKVIKAKKPIRKRRPRREFPEDLTDLFIVEGDSPNDLDVIAGRGGGSNHHEGNKRYWYRILQERPGYKQLGKNNNASKSEVAEAIYDYILMTGGRFLQMDTKTHDWFNIPKKICLDKIKQALRDRYVPHFAKTEPQTPPMASPLPAPSGPSEVDKQQFMAFLNKAPAPAPISDNFFTPSIDLTSLFQQFFVKSSDSIGKSDSPMFSLQNFFLNSQDFSLSQKSLDVVGKSGNCLDLMSKPSRPVQDDDWNEAIGTLPSIENQNESAIKSFDLGFRGHSLDLMRADLITTDKMSDDVTEAPKSLHALLQQQMESAIPSSRGAFLTAAV